MERLTESVTAHGLGEGLLSYEEGVGTVWTAPNMHFAHSTTVHAVMTWPEGVFASELVPRCRAHVALVGRRVATMEPVNCPDCF